MHFGVQELFNGFMILPPPDTRRAMTILRRVISAPTAPVHEVRIRNVLRGILKEAGISTRIDPYGNLTGNRNKQSGGWHDELHDNPRPVT